MNFRHSPFARAVVVPLSLLSFLSACTGWSTVKEPVAQNLAGDDATQLRVTMANGTQLMVQDPAIHDDTLTGYDTAHPVATRIPVDSITKMEMWIPGMGTQYRWDTADPPFDLALAETETDLIQITRTGGRVLEIENPVIEGTDLVGHARSAQQVAIPLFDIAKVEKRSVNAASTIGTVAVVGGVVALGAMVLIAQGMAPD